MVEKTGERPAPHGPEFGHPRPGHLLPHELGGLRPHEQPDPRGPRPPEPGEAMREAESRQIAEDLVAALGSEDHELKIKSVAGVLARFEFRKPPIEPRPELEHPKPPVSSEHPEPPRPHGRRP